MARPLKARAGETLSAFRTTSGKEHGKYYLGFMGVGYYPLMVENQMEKSMEQEMETGVIQGVVRSRVSPRLGALFWGS